MMNNARVLVVIPNYNGADSIRKCLTSLREQTYPHLRTVVVDNASSDNSPEIIRKEFPEMHLICNKVNTGWGEACNTGMQAEASDYVLVLNNDAYLAPECVEQMTAALESHPDYMACACRILLWEEPDKTEVAGLSIYRDGSSCGRGRLAPADRYGKREEVFAASGCCALYRRDVFETLGGFDSDFFMYCDDSDMGWRIQLAGGKCIYEPEAIAYHGHSRAAGSYSPLKAYHVERNRLLITFKHFPVWLLLQAFFFSVYRYAFQVYLARRNKAGALARFRQKHTWLSGLNILMRAHWDAFALLPRMWSKRREFFRRFPGARRRYRELFLRFGINTRKMAGYE